MEPPGTPASPRRGAPAEIAAVLVAALSTVAVLLAHHGGTGRAVAIERPVADGSAGYGFLHLDEETGLPARFDPCSPVSYVVNRQGAPRGAVEDVHEAFARAGVATGMSFDFEGDTDESPAAERRSYQPARYGKRWAPVLVAWADVSDVPTPHRTVHASGVLSLASLADRRTDVLGWATQTVMTHPTRQDVVVTGMVVLDLDGPAVRPGFGPGRRWGNVALHEVGHLLGLDHSDVRGEIMYPDAGHATGQWGDGDRAGLAQLGRDAGCLRVPDPR